LPVLAALAVAAGVPATAAAPLLALAPSPAWTAEADQTGANFGWSVAAAGDVNGDGYADVIIGSRFFDNGEIDEGRAWLYFGSATGPASGPAWTAEGDQAAAQFGARVAAAGDVNGDGFGDVIVTAFLHDHGEVDEGRAIVFHGSAAGLSRGPAWTAEGDQADAWLGAAAAGAGDVNGDGYADVVVGAPQYDNGQVDEGRALVYLGSAAGLSSVPAWTAEGEQVGAYFGRAVAAAGDVNGDGYADVLVGADGYANGEAGEGRAFVYLGSAAGLASVASWTAESDQVGAQFGGAVASAGDVDGDGFAEVLVGAQAFDGGQADEGRAYLFHGSAAGPAAGPAWVTEGEQAGAWFGAAVAPAGDVDGDGYADVIVGAYLHDNGQVNEGRAQVFHGSPTGLTTHPGWTAEADQANARFGAAVAGAGDVNGDGHADALVGSYLFDRGQLNEGRAFVYLGAGCVQSCDDGDICTEDFCVDAGCLYLPAGCSDGNACTDDVCQPGTGCVHAPHGCDDGNPCTEDLCAPALGCAHPPHTAPCDDANACTANDACDGGCDCCQPDPAGAPGCSAGACEQVVCAVDPFCCSAQWDGICAGEATSLCTCCDTGTCVGTPVGCDDADPCTDDTCDPGTGCVHAPNTQPCDDGNDCTVGDVCGGPTCLGVALDCTDGEWCTQDFCTELGGCEHVAPECADADACTIDTCDAAGGCAHAPAGCAESAAGVGPRVTTDTEGDWATPLDPLETALTLPAGAPGTLEETPAAWSAPGGALALGLRVEVGARSAPPEDPLQLEFVVDAAALPPGADAGGLLVFRDDAPVSACTGPAGTALPDPCLAERAVLFDGDAWAAVLASAGGRFDLAVAPCTVPGAVAGLAILGGGALAWSPSPEPDATYDVARGRIGELPVGAGAAETCFAAGVTGPGAAGGASPAPGMGWWYLVRARSACGPGGYGMQSDGAPRSTGSCP